VSATDDTHTGRKYPAFRRGIGPQVIDVPSKVTPFARSSGSQLSAPITNLRFPRLASARGVRRAHARLAEWVLAGLIDSIVATRLSFILGHVLKALEAEQLALAIEASRSARRL
jgi:hypothetical protein